MGELEEEQEETVVSVHYMGEILVQANKSQFLGNLINVSHNCLICKMRFIKHKIF